MRLFLNLFPIQIKITAAMNKPGVEVACPVSEVEKGFDGAQRGNYPTISPIWLCHEVPDFPIALVATSGPF
jgi:hypothetical protein